MQSTIQAQTQHVHALVDIHVASCSPLKSEMIFKKRGLICEQSSGSQRHSLDQTQHVKPEAKSWCLLT